MIPLMQLGEICEFESDVFNYFSSLAHSSMHISIHLHFYHVLFSFFLSPPPSPTHDYLLCLKFSTLTVHGGCTAVIPLCALMNLSMFLS